MKLDKGDTFLVPIAAISARVGTVWAFWRGQEGALDTVVFEIGKHCVDHCLVEGKKDACAFGEPRLDALCGFVLGRFFGDVFYGNLGCDLGHNISAMVGDRSAGTDGGVEMTGGEENDDHSLGPFASGKMSPKSENDRAAAGVLDR